MGQKACGPNCIFYMATCCNQSTGDACTVTGYPVCSNGRCCQTSTPYYCAALDACVTSSSACTSGTSCPSGTYQCGASDCAPNGTVCCASIGRPDLNCPQGTICTTSGCQSGSGGGGGTSTGCNTSGVADGCSSSSPFSCSASNSCYDTLSDCRAAVACGGSGTGGGGGSTNSQLCNTSGISPGCSGSSPYSCEASTTCYATSSECRNAVACGGSGAGGGGGSSSNSQLCNTSGISPGCSSSSPFSCEASTTCYVSLSSCRDAVACGGSGTGSGSGGGGGSDSSQLCNRSGVSQGCSSDAPFSCSASSACYTTYDRCIDAVACGGTGSGSSSGGGGGSSSSNGGGRGSDGPERGCTSTGLAPLLAAALFVIRRRRS